MKKIGVYMVTSTGYMDGNNGLNRPIAEMSLANAREYCERHGHTLIDDIVPESIVKGCWGFWRIEDIGSLIPKFDWIWLLATDTLIMNHAIDIRTLADDNFHFVQANDANGGNSHSLLFRNSFAGRNWISLIASMEKYYAAHKWEEQQAILEYRQVRPWSAMVKVIPQNLMNSCPFEHANQNFKTRDDDGCYRPGDLLIHFPGMLPVDKVPLMRKYFQQIIK